MGKRIFSEEFKREALRKAGETGATLSQVARDIGVKQQTLHRSDVFDYIERFYNQQRRHSTHIAASCQLMITSAFELALLARMVSLSFPASS